MGLVWAVASLILLFEHLKYSLFNFWVSYCTWLLKYCLFILEFFLVGVCQLWRGKWLEKISIWNGQITTAIWYRCWICSWTRRVLSMSRWRLKGGFSMCTALFSVRAVPTLRYDHRLARKRASPGGIFFSFSHLFNVLILILLNVCCLCRSCWARIAKSRP